MKFDPAKLEKLIELAAALSPQVAVLQDIVAVIRSGSDAEAEALLARLQAENDALGAV